jgi:hypothetical protein
MKEGKFFDQLGDYQLLQKPCSMELTTFFIIFLVRLSSFYCPHPTPE